MRLAICSWELTSLPITRTQSWPRSHTDSREQRTRGGVTPGRIESGSECERLFECLYEFRDGLGLRLGHPGNALLVGWLGVRLAFCYVLRNFVGVERRSF